eukprot:m.427852 g.427852  ORF g.427852 m.427852 type:complete len:55 (+) comp21366_c0_seq5:2391-2555(+)
MPTTYKKQAFPLALVGSHSKSDSVDPRKSASTDLTFDADATKRGWQRQLQLAAH